MAASLADGTTVIDNAAREPEIADVADCLNKMGARIAGAGTSRIVIEGVARLNGARHARAARPDRDRHLCDGRRHGRRRYPAQNARPELLQAALDVLQQTGVTVTPTNQGIRIARNGDGLSRSKYDRAVPGFPDRSASPADGADDARERHLAHRRDGVREPLHARARTGAARRPHPSDGERATIEGVERLKGAPVMATDLRASVSLVIAALAAEGETIVNRVYHLDRGFERLEDKLGAAAPPSSGCRGNRQSGSICARPRGSGDPDFQLP